MTSDQLKLAKNGDFLIGSVTDQISLFKEKFPPQYVDKKLTDILIWFYLPECPAGAVWVKYDDNGHEILIWT
ncbi:DUF596 domain-containing protein [Acinetobacter sp. MD2(2019)]|nr:DUF596 domain-containing protein [Acinetobacter sp. MD2(2019)]